VRRFRLFRTDDPSGVSGIGLVAEGIEFSSGAVAVHFLPHLKGVRTVYPYVDMADMFIIHGHGGKTKIVWEDD
jgi:hypothetical protein